MNKIRRQSGLEPFQDPRVDELISCNPLFSALKIKDFGCFNSIKILSTYTIMHKLEFSLGKVGKT